MIRSVIAYAVLWCSMIMCACQAPRSTAESSGPPQVLVFSRTTTFRHESIAAGIEMFEGFASRGAMSVRSTENADEFSDEALDGVDVVVFLNTTGDVLDEFQQNVLQRFVEHGGGFLGIHSASDTEYDWPWYGGVIGAYFASHPHVQPATLRVEDASHPATAALPRSWTHTDEWYNFDRNPRDGCIRVLMTVDESSYEGGAMGADHPVAWCRDVGEGRALYTALGHTDECFSDAHFQAHVLGAIEWLAEAKRVR